MIKQTLLYSILLAANIVFAQEDTVFVYDFRTQLIDTILPVTYDTTATFDHTSDFEGSMGNATFLPFTPPSNNLYTGSQFSRLTPASTFFEVAKYPIRTAVSLVAYVNDTIYGRCSGQLVGSDFVVSLSYCYFSIWGSMDSTEVDSILIIPAYDNGVINPNIPTSYVDKIYFIKNRTEALLQLRNPIGNTVGWVGMGFNQDDAFYNQRIFHKLSYPGNNHPWTGYTRDFNGDTLHYNYGYIEKTPFSLRVSQGAGVPGMGGSTFFTIVNGEYVSYGVLFLSGYNHQLLPPSAFYQFKNILDHYSLSSTSFEAKRVVSVYPNPCRNTTRISFDNPGGSVHDVILIDYSGRQIWQSESARGSEIEISVSQLPAGVYVYILRNENTIVKRDKIIVQR